MNLTAPVSVERVVKAPASAVFALLSDPSRHRDIDGSGTVRDSPSRTVGLGDEFGTDMRAGISYKMVNHVIEFEQDRRIAWQARSSYDALKKVIGGRIWRYELEPVEGGTLVRETWDISQEALPLLVAPMRGLTRVGITRTLDRIEKLVA